MAQVHCLRCNKDAEGLPSAPIPSPVGQKIFTSICAPCWHEWMTMSTKIINEYRLQLFRPEHRTVLEEQMKLFLSLP